MRTTAALLLLLASYITNAQERFTAYFDHNKPVPTHESLTSLQQFLHGIDGAFVLGVTIKGYTDKTGEDDYNMLLSQKRAYEIMQIIHQSWPDVKMESWYFGSQNPVSEKDEELHLNRRVEITVTLAQMSYTVIEPKTLQLQPYHVDVELQSFPINLDDTVIIKGKEGTMIKIAPGSIMRKDLSMMKGTATAILKEYYQPADIILAGMHTVSTEGILQTGGMFNLFIVQDGDTASKQTAKTLDIRMPMNNPELTDMNVFEQRHTDADTALWVNSKRLFRQMNSYWQWPSSYRVDDMFYFENAECDILRVGGVLPDEFQYYWRPFRRMPITKKYNYTVKKIDSVTLKVDASIRYRRWAVPKTGTLRLDTSFIVSKITAQYVTEIDRMGFMNCDRFYKMKTPAELIVSTPGFTGMTVMLYFKNLSAFLPAEPAKNGYRFDKLPEGEPVSIVVMGRKDGEVYFAQQRYLTERNGKVNISLTKITAEQCRKNLEQLVNP